MVGLTGLILTPWAPVCVRPAAWGLWGDGGSEGQRRLACPGPGLGGQQRHSHAPGRGRHGASQLRARGVSSVEESSREERGRSRATAWAAQPTPALMLPAPSWPDPSSLRGQGSEEHLLVQSELDLLAIHVRPEPVTAEPALLPTHKVSPAGRVFAPYPVTQIGTGCSEGSGALGDAILGLPLGLDIRGLR